MLCKYRDFIEGECSKLLLRKKLLLFASGDRGYY